MDESKARGLQSMYEAGAPAALQALHEECTLMAQTLARDEMKSYGLPLSHDRAQQIASDAAGALMVRYLADPGFTVKRFSKYLGFRVREQLFISPRQKQRTFEDKTIFSDEAVANSTTEDLHADVAAVRDRLLELVESHPRGKKAAADLCRSRSYRQAIRRVSAYVGRQWIYDHAEALHEVYRALHWKEGANGRLHRSGLAAVREALLQGKRDQRKPADQ